MRGRPLDKVWSCFERIETDKFHPVAKCMFCEEELTTGQVGRLKKHIFECKSAPVEFVSEFGKPLKTKRKSPRKYIASQKNKMKKGTTDFSDDEQEYPMSQQILEFYFALMVYSMGISLCFTFVKQFFQYLLLTPQGINRRRSPRLLIQQLRDVSPSLMDATLLSTEQCLLSNISTTPAKSNTARKIIFSPNTMI